MGTEQRPAALSKLIGSAFLQLLLISCTADTPKPALTPNPTLANPTPLPEASPTVLMDSSTVKKTGMEYLEDYLAKQNTHSDEIAVKALNSPDTGNDSHKNIIKQWGEEPIFPTLTTREAKMRFIRYLLHQDNLDQKKYQSPNYGPDVNKDGVVSITTDSDGRTINEQGAIVDTASYVCGDFAEELTIRYGFHDESQNPSQMTDSKFSLPLFSVSINEGYVTSASYSKAAGRGHSFNAIFLGADISDIENVNNWLFIEPQSDEIVANPMKHLIDGKILTIHIPHTDYFNTEGDDLVSYFLKSDGTWDYITHSELQIVEKVSNWVSLNEYPPRDSKGNILDNQMDDEPKLAEDKPSDIYRVITLMVDSGYISPTQAMQALHDAHLPPGFSFKMLEPNNLN